jgi:membrane protease YdiL (CAAX protease family)
MKSFLRKYFLVFIYLFIGSLYLLTRSPNKPLDKQAVIYSAVIFGTCGTLALAKRHPVRLLGLSWNCLSGKLFLAVLPVFLAANAFLIYFDSALSSGPPQVRPFTFLLLMKTIFPLGQIRAFGEEIIFRGFLLSQTLKNDEKTWWTVNILQAAVFTTLHALIPMPLLTKLVFIGFVFGLSIAYGLLNRRFQSLLPSAILHGTNGLALNLVRLLS